ncbi:MAG TPA: PAS domain-containing sensor histidine kinase, partial [Leptospiraceae bacterium]|nr:PAS domain-containing sensor histidine kinase [Leptospiraceae bacterium]
EGEILYANLAAQRILGLSFSQINGRNSNHPDWMSIHEDGSFFSGDEHPGPMALRTGNSISNVTMGIFNPIKQQYIWIQIDAVPVFIENSQKPIGVYAVFEDITEYKKNKDVEKDLFVKLRKSNLEVSQRQQAIDQHAIVAITDYNGTIIYANSKFCTLSKYSREELIGQNHRILNSGYHSKYFFHNMYSTIKKGETWHGEIRNQAKDGSYYWVATTIAPLRNLDGEIEHFIAIRTDITKRVQAEEALRISEARTRAILDTSPDSIIFIDLDYRIQFFNDTANSRSKIFLNTELTIGKSMLHILPESRIENFTLSFHSALKGEIITHIRNFSTNSGTVWFEVLYTPIKNKSSEVIGVMFTARDITAKREAETERERYLEDLENLNHTKDKFFNIIAHDLKNPFAGILGISEMLESKLKESESQYTKEDLLKMANLIQSSARSASNLLDNLLHWARSQTGELQCDLIITSINSIIEATIPLISGIAFNKQIEIEKNLDAEKFVLADPSLTNTILRNLFTNSIKFTNPGGKIIVRTKFNNDYAEISIEDTGIGIKEEHLSKLFRIDSKITKLGTNGEKGTGLGLILCKEFTEKQNGKIWVESEFNKGSKFTFILPIAL